MIEVDPVDMVDFKMLVREHLATLGAAPIGREHLHEIEPALIRVLHLIRSAPLWRHARTTKPAALGRREAHAVAFLCMGKDRFTVRASCTE